MIRPALCFLCPRPVLGNRCPVAVRVCNKRQALAYRVRRLVFISRQAAVISNCCGPGAEAGSVSVTVPVAPKLV